MGGQEAKQLVRKPGRPDGLGTEKRVEIPVFIVYVLCVIVVFIC